MFNKIKIRKGQPDPKLNEMEFHEEFKKDFYDPRFRDLDHEIEKLTQIAWENYNDHRKSPITEKAGLQFQDPEFDLSTEWLITRNKLLVAKEAQKTSQSRILIINASPRSEHTCPGEMSKSYRLLERAKKVIESRGVQADILDLSRLTSGYKKIIYPCKACVSTAMPLCHWPCSCYPNHSLGQNHDCMNEIYEQWISAHGIMIITPVHWYQTPSPLKLMMDRLVCADGGNPDPTTTHGKNPEEAKKIEMKGWDFPKHLEGRAFSVVVHGDSAGLEDTRRSLIDWLTDLHLVQAGVASSYVGYFGTYAESHNELDKNEDFLIEVESAAESLIKQIELIRNHEYVNPNSEFTHPMQK
ncbi:MAG: flavodoxin family protein [Bacteriovorax sp.]|nr:flavodoxin family protein [Bacteriovorax sp.]